MWRWRAPVVSDVTARLLSDGFAALEGIIDREALRELQRATATLDVGTGLRAATSMVPLGHELAHGSMLDLARSVLGDAARPVRSILFDKTAASNWLVPWHQDLTVAVRERHEVPGWGPWSAKAGMPHVQPPAAVLEAMVTLRLHLDDTPGENGALRVVPGSHAHGVLTAEAARELREARGEVICAAAAGELLVMRPLLLHASSKATRPGRRRVLHVEYAAGDLPAPLAWAE